MKKKLSDVLDLIQFRAKGVSKALSISGELCVSVAWGMRNKSINGSTQISGNRILQL